MKTYKGIDIFKCGPNSSGMRYYARIAGRTLKADSLAGIKNLIRGHKQIWWA